MKTHFANHLRAGRHLPGLFLVRRGSRMLNVVDFLVAATYASEPADWQDQWVYIP